MTKYPSNKSTNFSKGPAQSHRGLTVFTDGACSGNGTSQAKGGYATVWPGNSQLNQSGSVARPTSNRAEYKALSQALETANKVDPSGSKPLHVYTDSKLVADSLCDYLPKWKNNGFTTVCNQPVRNQDLIRECVDRAGSRQVTMTHVRGHTGNNDWASRHNNQADTSAKGALRR